MKTIDFVIMQLRNGMFRAAANGFTHLDTNSLEGFRERILTHVKRSGMRDRFRLRFILSKELRANFSDCEKCRGEGEIRNPNPGAVAGYLAGIGDKIEFSGPSMIDCDACEGMAVVILGFRD